LDPRELVRDNLRERKEAVYENLRDLNFEYEAGTVPGFDHAALKSSLQEKAATILAEIARLEKNSAPAVGRTRLSKKHRF
jgi:hypothetical protein